MTGRGCQNWPEEKGQNSQDQGQDGQRTLCRELSRVSPGASQVSSRASSRTASRATSRAESQESSQPSSQLLPQAPPFLRLPPELYLYIIKFLNYRDLQQLRSTNRYFKLLPSARDKSQMRQRYIDDFFKEEKQEKDFEDAYLKSVWSEGNVAVTLRCYVCFRRRHICMFAGSQSLGAREKGARNGWKRYCVICAMKKRWWELGSIHRLEWSIGIYCRLCHGFQLLPYRRYCKSGLCEVCERLTDFVGFDVSDTRRRRKKGWWDVFDWDESVVIWGVDRRPRGSLHWGRVRQQVLLKMNTVGRKKANDMKELMYMVDGWRRTVRNEGAAVMTVCNQWTCSTEYPDGWSVDALFVGME